MITYDRALKYILNNTVSLPTEQVLIEDSLCRTLNEDVYSKIEMPPFDKSAVDGYALKVEDIKAIPIKLKCIGLVQAGQVFKKKLKPCECVKIMTGAPLPKGCDGVVMVEDTIEIKNERLKNKNENQDYFVQVFKKIIKGENVCLKGEDIRPNQRLIACGTKISLSSVALLATGGLRFIKVNAMPRVTIINTGGEIVPLGSKLAKNKIYNSNGPMLEAMLKSDGIQPKFFGIVKDDVKQLKKAIKKSFNTDILLISGGVSMGDYDFVPFVLNSLGVEKIFHKVKIKPGKPLFFGKKNKTLVFGIPGNPVSNFLTYLIFIRPALYKMMGYKNCNRIFKEGIIGSEFHSKSDRRHFILVKITKKRGCYYLHPIKAHGSADVLALSYADGFMMVDDNLSMVKKNSKVQFVTWKTI